MSDLPNLAGRVFNTPLAIDPDKAAVILRAIGPRLLSLPDAGAIQMQGAVPQGQNNDTLAPRASIIGDELHTRLSERPGAGYSNYRGVAIVPVVGTLVRRGAWVGSNSGETSYEGLSAVLRAAASNPDVKAIALEVDSFGGEANGIYELGALIRQIRAEKPVHAFVSDYALSAGYAIASQASRVTVPEFGKAGSIGVVVMHADFSGQLDKEGIAVTFITAGAHKVDGNPFQPLDRKVQSRIQADVDKHYAAFAMLVGAGRGDRLTPKGALSTEAMVLSGPDAVARGLADEVADARSAFQAFVEKVNSAPVSAPAGSTAAASLTVARSNLIDRVAPLIAPLELEFEAEIMAAARSLTFGSPGCATGADAPSTKELVMSKTSEKQPDAVEPKVDNTAEAKPSESSKPDATTAERNRATAIMDRVEKAGLPATFASKLIADGVSLETAYERIIDEKASRAQDGGEIASQAPVAVVTGDVVDRTSAGLTKAILFRAGMTGGEQNEFTGMSLREIARETLRARGLSAPSGGVMAVVGAAFSPSMAGGMHSTSDFGNILADVANKSMLRGFEETEESYSRFTSTGTLGDFKPSRRVGLDAFPSLAKVEEGAEFKYGSIGDFGELAVLATYGKLFAITRQAIINDDLDAFTRVPMKMGRAARRTVGDLVWAILTGNPNMSDATALFHADHGNLAAAGAVPSELTINAGITAMATQKDRSKNATALNIAPKFLLAPPKHRSVVLQALNSEYAPDDTDKAGSAKQPRAYNTVRNAADPIFDARIADDSWFLAADPAIADTIEVSYLDGQATPFLDQQDGWKVDGTEFKVRIDAAATPLAWEGLYKNPGS